MPGALSVTGFLDQKMLQLHANNWKGSVGKVSGIAMVQIVVCTFQYEVKNGLNMHSIEQVSFPVTNFHNLLEYWCMHGSKFYCWS